MFRGRRLWGRIAGGAACIAVTGAALAETPGKDGDVTVSSAVTVNAYGQISGTAGAGSASVTTVSAITGLSVGDLVMIYQAQGASIDSTDTAAYGAVSAYNSAGRYEFQTVASVSGTTITFATYAGNCSGLRYTYSGTSGAQVVRVPQYRNLTVNTGGSISATAWNGATGGITAFTVAQTATLNGTVSANAAGFRGGALDNANSAYPVAAIFRTADPTLGAEKGESIAGYQTSLPSGLYYGRGAPANGGGGGNAHNAGGGGGANGDNGGPWAGQGVPDLTNATWATAWNIDGTLTSTTNNAGGGRGGYTYGASNQNALVVPPGNSAWAGDGRSQTGGLGGRPLAFDRTSRIFFGGGGGAGDSNDAVGGAGGRGGGIIFIQAAALSGSGSVAANGAAGAGTTGAGNDAPGGGGGGGTILVQFGTGGALTYTATGGAGGIQTIPNTDESEGPGGGGGGGVIAVSAGTRTANGGVNGTTTSRSLSEFPPNGATRGATGLPNATGLSRGEVPLCYAPAPTVSKTSATFETVGPNRFNIPAADVIYTITVTNPGTQIDNGTLTILDALPAQLTFYNGDIDDAGPLTGPFQFIDGTTSSSLSCCSGAQVAYSQFASGTDFTYVPVAGYDANVRRIRFTPTGAMAPGSITATSFQVRLRARIN